MQLSNEISNALSAEAALGTLRGPAAVRWQRLCMGDEALADNVNQWQQLLAPMAHWLPETPVPGRVWDGIEQQLFATPTPLHRPSRVRWAGIALAMAASLGLWLALPSATPTRPDPTQQLHALAVLSSEHQATRWQLNQRSDGQLSISTSSAWPSKRNRSLELWAIDASGTPHSLGLIRLIDQQATLTLTASQREHLAQVTVFAISEEPLGGSLGALPSGPVLFTGKVTKS